MTETEPAPTEACPAVAVRVGRFTKNSRLGNVLMFLGSALISAEDEGGSALISRGHVPSHEVYLSKRPPVDIYFNSTRFCVPASKHFFKTAWAVANNVTSEPDPVLSKTHQATTNCTLGSPECSGPGCYGSCPSFTCQDPCACGSRNRRVSYRREYHYLRFRHALQTYALPNFFVGPQTLPNPDTLVIHIRSGDIMVDGPGEKIGQPPLAYYKYIIETFHPSDPVHICTENHGAADGKAGGNPVVAALMAWRPDQITMPPASLANDAAILLGARFLVEATSSFSWVMAAMNPRLERVYRPIYGRFRPDGTPMGPARGVNKNECGCCAFGFPNQGRRTTAVVELTMTEYRPFVTNGARFGKDQVKNDFADRARAMMSYAGPIEPAEMPLPPPTGAA